MRIGRRYWVASIVCGLAMVGVAAQQHSTPPTREGLLKDVRAPKDFDATIFAMPPEVSYPTCIAATATGELFVGVDENGSLDRAAHRGRIVRCVDTNNDGVADKFTTFCQLDSPRGLSYDGKTLYVLHPPLLEAYHDDNGDGVADRHEVLISGIGHDLHFRGADHTINGIRMGIDGWIYIACGDYGFGHATGTDGKSVQLYGGGVVRVRPDGSELEIYSHHTRNLYDVSVSPTLDVFTRDNTNDGGGWNVRFGYMIPTADYGYPSLFVNFPGEFIDPLEDTGGGSPTGSLFLHEPGFPADINNGMLTCEWGRSHIDRHHLAVDGAGYKIASPDSAIIHITRPTDIDVDGQGHLFIASWRGATFTNNGPYAGYITRLTWKDNKRPPMPDPVKASDEQLLGWIAGPSAVAQIQAQREVLRRGSKPEYAAALRKLTGDTGATIEARVAAIFTLKQMQGAEANPFLIKLMDDASVREWALRAATDRVTQAANVPTDVLAKALKDASPRVRLAAVVALERLNRHEAAGAIASLLTDPDFRVVHVTVRALAAMHAGEVCLKNFDSTDNPAVVASARALQLMHDPSVVNGLIERLGRSTDVAVKKAILGVLCRLYNREADWNGKTWWGTRPDTSGPYFRPVKWDQSDKILAVLHREMTKADPAMLQWLIVEMGRNKVDMTGTTELLLNSAQHDAAFRAKVVDIIGGTKTMTDPIVEMLGSVAANPAEQPALRAKALSAMQRSTTRKGRQMVFNTFRDIRKAGHVAPELEAAWEEYARDGRNVQNANDFIYHTKSRDRDVRVMTDVVLLHIAEAKQLRKHERDAVEKAIEFGWSSEPDRTVTMLQAVTEVGAVQYADRVRALVSDKDAGVRQAAAAAVEGLRLNTDSGEKRVAQLGYDDALAAAEKAHGDVKLGSQLFLRQGCVACHTIRKDEAPKAPFLGDVGGRFTRAEITESVLKPSAKIAQGFNTNWFKLKDGSTVTAFVIHENGDSVDIRDIAGVTRTLSADQIVKRGTLKNSMMPEGLAANLTVHEFASLLDYLQSLK